MQAIIRRSLVCRIGLSDGDRPYVVPLSFGYENNTLYFHGGAGGRKVQMLRKNNAVCFEFDVDVEMSPSDQPCSCGLKYRSILGYGKAFFIEEPAEKQQALSAIMGHYGGTNFQFSDDVVRRTTVFRVEIESMTGKESGY
jgi:hypothetical protein